MLRRPLAWAALLVLPLAILLFAQWPLRGWVQAGSREANDLGQVVFAIYCACAVAAAGRAGIHFSARPDDGRAWRSWAVLGCIGPWAVFVLWTSAAPIWNSVVSAERFPDSFNPGFFLVKSSLALLVVLALVDAVAHAWRAGRGG